MITIMVGPSRSFTSIQSAIASVQTTILPAGLTDNVDIRVDAGTYQVAGTGPMVALGDVLSNGYRVTIQPDGSLRSVILDAQLTNLHYLMWTNNANAKNFTVRGLKAINHATSGSGATLQQIGVNTYEGNIIEECEIQMQGNGVAFSNLGSGTLSGYFIVRNNFAFTPIAFAPTERGVNFEQVQTGISGLKLLGNTFNRFDRGVVSIGGLQGVVIQNNIFTGIVSRFHDLSVAFHASAVVSHNVYYSTTAAVWRIGVTNYATLALWQAASGKDANSINADPLLTSLTDPHVLAGSPTIGAGVQNADMALDYDGTARLNPPDIGADQRTSSTGNGNAFRRRSKP